jgi:phospholipid/cholesterol/gamma-HCH transport system permease protein
MDTPASIEVFPQKIVCCGNWTVLGIQALNEQLNTNTLTLPQSSSFIIDMQLIEHFDTAGAWLLHRLTKLIHEKKIRTETIYLDEKQKNLMALLVKAGNLNILEKMPKLLSPIERLGKDVTDRSFVYLDFLSFIGQLSILSLKSFMHPLRLGWNAIASVIESAGFYALPIIALLSFLVGVVLAYQMGVQLRNYGASLYIVDLLGLAILREFGPLITAIILAGRTGAAFTAEIGTMMVNEEVDALQTMGINPIYYLGLPKLLGMLVVLPLLTVWANIFGILGGMIMARSMFELSFINFFDRFYENVVFSNYAVGLVKTPFFAMIIATIGCFQGFQVVRRADSVGQQTTTSVVRAIFMIIIVDAGFSILFSWAKL